MTSACLSIGDDVIAACTCKKASMFVDQIRPLIDDTPIGRALWIDD